MIASPFFTLIRPAWRWAEGETGIPSQEFPKSTVPRLDGSGLETFPITDSSHGNPQQLAQAIMTEVINNIGGGFRYGRTPKAVQVGGPLGGIFPLSLLHLNLSHETLREMGASLAVGAIQVLDDRDCLVSLVRDQLEFLINQPGGQCPSCHEALSRIRDLLAEIAEGGGSPETLQELQRRGEALKLKGACQLSRHAVNPWLTSLHYFPEEYRLHLENKHCPARVCPKLLLAPCHQACPPGIDIPSFMGLIAQGEFQEAWEVMREDNPFPWVCALACPTQAID